MRLRPPATVEPIDKVAREFARLDQAAPQEPRSLPATQAPPPDLPWLAADIRPNKLTQIPVRLNEAHKAKLKWLEQKRAIRTQAEFVRDVLEPAIDKLVEEVLARR